MSPFSGAWPALSVLARRAGRPGARRRTRVYRGFNPACGVKTREAPVRPPRPRARPRAARGGAGRPAGSARGAVPGLRHALDAPTASRGIHHVYRSPVPSTLVNPRIPDVHHLAPHPGAQDITGFDRLTRPPAADVGRSRLAADCLGREGAVSLARRLPLPRHGLGRFACPIRQGGLRRVPAGSVGRGDAVLSQRSIQRVRVPRGGRPAKRRRVGHPGDAEQLRDRPTSVDY